MASFVCLLSLSGVFLIPTADAVCVHSPPLVGAGNYSCGCWPPGTWFTCASTLGPSNSVSRSGFCGFKNCYAVLWKVRRGTRDGGREGHALGGKMLMPV